MFLLREVEERDLQGLLELAHIQAFLNWPRDEDTLKKKITHSIQSFRRPDSQLEKNSFIFALESLEEKKIVGASIIQGQHGTPQRPHFFLKVGTEHKFSETINTGFIHRTLKLGVETQGWSEIGGLILRPDLRGHKEKLGKQLSYIRFLYMALFRDYFTETIHCELMPPFGPDDRSPLWEAIGRRFLNMDYRQADQLSHDNKEFILGLFPLEMIYETLLPGEARDAIGKVGETTRPVKGMLEKIGFRYVEEIDPFDGGPHYRALRESISPIRDSFSGRCCVLEHGDSGPRELLLAKGGGKDGLWAWAVRGKVEDDSIFVPREAMERYALSEGERLSGTFMDY